MSEIIYEKHYPHKSFEEEMKELEEYQKELESSPDYVPSPTPTFEEFYKELVENTTLVALPKRIEQADDFIQLAIRTGEAYEFDTKILQSDCNIMVYYFFDGGSELLMLMPIIKMADCISVEPNMNGFKIQLCLDYYTHAVYRNGRLIHPKYLEP